MKKSFVIRRQMSLVIMAGIGISMFFLVNDAALAQPQGKASSIQALEYSMKGLYESASEVASKNKWLTVEIEKMEQEIRFLEGEIQTLESREMKKKISTALDDREIMSLMPWDEKRLNALYEDYIELDEENVYLKDRLLGKQNDQKDIEAAVERAEKEIAMLGAQQKKLRERLNQPVEPLDFNRLQSALSRSQKSLKYAANKYKKLEKDYGRPLVKFNKIKDDNLALKGKLAYMKGQLNSFEAQQQSLTEEIQQIMAKSDNAGELSEDIRQLKQERQALLLVLDKAKQKLGPEFNAPDYDREIEAAGANIAVIEQNNEELKRKLNSQQKKLIRE